MNHHYRRLIPLSLLLFLCSVQQALLFEFQKAPSLWRKFPSYRRSWSPDYLYPTFLQSTADEEALLSTTGANSSRLVNMAVKAVGSSTTMVVSGAFFVVLAWKRDALMVSFFIGAIANGILSKVLKRIINQTRPPELEEADIHLKPSDNGMPSSHAMSLGFISTFIALNLPWTQIPLAVYAVVSLAYRVQVKLHTWQQVVVGSVIGSFDGFAWFCLCTGDNPWKVNVMSAVTTHFLDANGQLPLPMLLVPLLVGAATIGSFERRIGYWLKQRKDQ
jgi:membrane-associated phospholipid phosphatase